MVDIGARLIRREWPEMVGGDDALSQLLQLRTRDLGSKLRLSQEKAL